MSIDSNSTATKQRTTKAQLIEMLSNITSSLGIPILFNGKEVTTDFSSKTIFDDGPEYDINHLYDDFGITSEIGDEISDIKGDEELINTLDTLSIATEKEVQNSKTYSSAIYKGDNYSMSDTCDSDTC